MKRHQWTKQDKATLRELWPVNTAIEVSAAMGLSVPCVSCKAVALGLKKAPAHLRKVRRAARYSGMWS